MAENTTQETYLPCLQVIQEIAKEQGLDMGHVELIMDEISAELRAHPAKKFMSDAQQECWLVFRLWCSLFPEKQSDFPGDKAPLEEYEKETTDRRMAKLVALRASKNKNTLASRSAGSGVESTPHSSDASATDDGGITALISQVSDITSKKYTWAKKVGEPAPATSEEDIISQRFNADLDVRILAAKIAHGEENLKNVYSHRPLEHPLSQEERTKALTIISELQPMRGGKYVYSVSLPADPETRKRFTEGGQQSLSKASEMLKVAIRSDYRPNVRHFIYPWPLEYNVLKDKEAAAADLIFAYNVLVFWEYSMRNDKMNHITVERAAELMRSETSMPVTAWLMATNRSDPRIRVGDTAAGMGMGYDVAIAGVADE
ncbi:uncharacterized protein RAG0_14079 [Rhynchosporium agropyri]|uniref:Uncharacterized protein n=1 Tax=Rhynchosporium agropyri TaxID=914238 RepID=A0A1E1LFF9_9HELO|nr:uncharacterized protein RAG0_14079 [Rhynchosporium agropyri]